MNPAVNPESLAALRALNPDDPAFLRELIDVFLADSPRSLAELEQALAAGDAAQLARAAHTLKGSASNFGADDFAAGAAAMEKLGRLGAIAEAAAALPALRAEYDRVAGALRAHR